MGPSIVFLSILAANMGGPEQIEGASTRWDDVLRHPVSVYRLSRTLGLPYETVRRYAARLIQKSLSLRIGQGLMVSPSALDTPRIAELLATSAAMATRMHADFQRLGANLSSTGHLVGEAHERRVAALSIFYFLKGVDIATETLSVDPVPAMVHFTIHRANLDHLADRAPVDVLDEAHVHLDEVRRPVSVFAVARRLNLPYETARRHVRALAKQGLVQRAADEGFIVPAELLKTQPFIDCVQSTMAATTDFLETAFSSRMH